MLLLELLVLVVIAGVVGALAQALAGQPRGGCVVSIAIGFVGAAMGTLLASELRLPSILALQIGNRFFPLEWSIVGATLFVAVLAFLSRHRA